MVAVAAALPAPAAAKRVAAGRWRGTTSQAAKSLTFDVSRRRVLSRIRFDVDIVCTRLSDGVSWSASQRFVGLRTTRGPIKRNGTFFLRVERPEQLFLMGGGFRRRSAEGLLHWAYWIKDDGTFAYEAAERYALCGTPGALQWRARRPRR